MEKVKEVILFKTKTGKYGVKRSDKQKPSRYFTTIDKAKEWIEEKYDTTVVENL